VEAGTYARRRYRDARWAQLRREGRAAATVIALTATMLSAGIAFGGTVALLAAMLLGFTTGLFLFLWILGDVRALPWLWGAIGEEDTARELEKLDSAEWQVEHDIERETGGNWDHIVAGPTGTFMLETKTFHAEPVRVDGDSLVSGRMRLRGSWFRSSALELKQLRNLRWVQAVVVIWGDFPQRLVEEERVVYVAGRELVPWLESRA
jgi:hypothetical protein